MRYGSVFIDSMAYELAPNVVSSALLEERLSPLFQALKIQPGQVAGLTGVEERRFWDPHFPMSEGAARAGSKALAASAVNPTELGAVLYAGVCRDGYEPATACAVAHALGVGPETLVFDVGNACLGVLNGCMVVADLIESGQIRAGLVTSCETAREIVDSTIDRMLAAMSVEVYRASFATLTGGSGAAAVLLTDGSFPEVGHRHRLLGGAVRAAPEHHKLCHWGLDRNGHPLMMTDAAGVLKNGVVLGTMTFHALLREMGWAVEDVSKVICHQVAAAHRVAILKALGIPIERDYPTFEYLGNMGTVSLPLTAAMAAEHEFLVPGDRVGFLGIGSGLNCLMLGVDW